MPGVEDLRKIAEIEFADIITDTYQIDYKLRIVFIDKSFLDAFLSKTLPDRFGFHWECMEEQGKKAQIHRVLGNGGRIWNLVVLQI